MKELTEIENFLNQLKCLLIETSEMKAAIQRYKQEADTIQAIRYDVPRVTGSHQSDLSDVVIQRENTVRKLMEEWAEREKQLTMQLETLQNLLPLLSDGTQRGVIIARYINGKTWEMIAEEYHYSERSIRRLHNKAIYEWQAQGEKVSSILKLSGFVR